MRSGKYSSFVRQWLIAITLLAITYREGFDISFETCLEKECQYITELAKQCRNDLTAHFLLHREITASNTKMYLWSVSHDIWTIWWYIAFIVWPFTQLGMCSTDRVWICSSHFSRHDNMTTQILHVHSIILSTYAFNGSNCRHHSPIKYPHYPTSNLHYSVQVFNLAPMVLSYFARVSISVS